MWTIHVISVLCLLCFCARLVITALWSPSGQGLTSWLSFVMSKAEVKVCYFPIDILGQVWYLIVSIPDLCCLSYFIKQYAHEPMSHVTKNLVLFFARDVKTNFIFNHWYLYLAH